MAKRNILEENYSPVGARLERYRNRQAHTEGQGAQEPAPVESTAPTVEPPPAKANGGTGEAASLAPVAKPRPRRRAKRVVEEKPTEAPAAGMTDVLRCRVTGEERRRWHDLSYRVTGEHNQFSRIFRALLVLLEHAEGELDKKVDELQRLRRPAKADRVGIAMYEYQLAQILYDAMRSSGRPKA